MTLKTSRTSAIRAGLGTTATSLAVLILATSGAFAQEGTEVITVTGFRASLENTIALKKESNQIVEAVSAEDIGKLPDSSIAEAIARLPGLAAQRLNGRAQDISIRGLAPDFSTTLLNGREQVSTSNNRSAQYDQYPSELMSGVVVYKTPTADLVGQGLSGTVDMRTIRPLDFDHRVLSFNARGETGSMGKLVPSANKYGYRFNGTYIDQYAGGKLGLTLGIALMDSPQQFIEYSPWGYPTLSDGTSLIGGAKWQANTDNLTRKSAMATLQYRPTENWESTFDVFLTQYKDAQQFVRVEAPLVSWGNDGNGNGIGLAPGYTVRNGFVSSGRYTTSAGTGVKAVLRQQMDRHNNNLFAIGWKNTFNVGAWTLGADISHSNVQRKDQWFEAYSGTGRAGFGATDPMSFVVGSNNVEYVTNSQIDYGDFNKILATSSQGWGGCDSVCQEGMHGGQDGYLNYQHVRDHLTSAKLTADWDAKWGPIAKVSLGLNYSNRHKIMMPEQYYIATTDNYNSYNSYVASHGNDTGWVPVSTVIPEKYRFGVAHGLSYFGIPNIVSFDSERMLNDGFYTKRANINSDVTVSGWQVDEMAYTAFVRADIDTMIANIPLVGNAGVQFVETHQSSDGRAVSNSGTNYGHSKDLHDGTNYGEVLPSVNLTAKITENHQIRFGAARQMVRARMDQMSAANQFTFDTAHNAVYAAISPKPALDLVNYPIWGGSLGSAKLRPWVADALDVSYEFYFGRAGYISIAGFNKWLEHYIYKKQILFDFTGYSYTGSVAPQYWTGYVSQYQNGKGGRLSGFEVSLAATGDMLTDYLEGFGLTGNMSYTDSSIKRDPSDPKGPLEGLSKLVTNTTVYYETGGFSVRLNHSYRSKFLGEVTGFGAGRELTLIKPQNWLDGQISYEFQEGSMKGLSVLFQANNILNGTQISYERNGDNLNDARKVHDYQKYGTTFLFGVTYKMN